MHSKVLLPCKSVDTTDGFSFKIFPRKIIELLLDYFIDSNTNIKYMVLTVMIFVHGFDA